MENSLNEALKSLHFKFTATANIGIEMTENGDNKC